MSSKSEAEVEIDTVKGPGPSARDASEGLGTGPRRLNTEWIHLGRKASAVVQPPFDDMSWYEDYGRRHQADGSEGRLVSMFTFNRSWDIWEVHPKGSEVVLCTAGAITLVQEIDGREVRTTLRPGEYAINPPGVWHTADVVGKATAVFITAGAGTDHRPRQ